MKPANEKLYTSPQRKLVKFFECSRERWKAKSRAAKTVLKRRGARMGRLEQSTAAYQQQLAALQRQVAEWQAKHAQTVRELEELKKKRQVIPTECELEEILVGKSSGIIIMACRTCWWWCPWS